MSFADFMHISWLSCGTLDMIGRALVAGSSLNGDFGGYFKNAITGDEFHLSGKIRPSKFNKDEDEEKKVTA